MLSIKEFIPDFPASLSDAAPWDIAATLAEKLQAIITTLGDDFVITDQTAIHRTATIEPGVILKGPMIIGAKCFIAAHAYLRGGVYLGESVSIGPGCEVKSSVILAGSTAAHFNFIGDSIIGAGVNIEAGAVIANHHNDREDKRIRVYHNGITIETGVVKFGALVGDGCKIGANAVLSPGTILVPGSVVKRLELVEQGK